MRVVMFYHSLISDWNHGNAHFLRGIVSELLARGHEVAVYEPRDGWSRHNLIHDHGGGAVKGFYRAFPHLRSVLYDRDTLDLDRELRGADVVIVHEWNEPQLVAAVGRHRRRRNDYRLLFHDTHHRLVSTPEAIRSLELDSYDGVLAFGRVIGELYRRQGLARRVWAWHEAADVRVFQSRPETRTRGDLVWIGNWGDEERTAELEEFLIEPVRRLGLKAAVYGVRYPQRAIRALQQAGIEYRGWLANHRVPEVFAQFRATIHVPRGYYARQLPGIPTIRVFEALACGIPLISAPWVDSEGLFRRGRDYLLARDGREMTHRLHALLADKHQRRELARHGRRTILQHHTCGHRVNELMNILRDLDVGDTISHGRSTASVASSF